MIEFDRYRPEEQQSSCADAIIIAPGQASRFFLNENITILVTGNSANSAGQVLFLNGINDVLDFSLCSQDPSTGELVKIGDDLDPKDPCSFSGNEIIRLRYQSDDALEEARFTHRSSDGKRAPKICTTQRMRRIMKEELTQL